MISCAPSIWLQPWLPAVGYAAGPKLTGTWGRAFDGMQLVLTLTDISPLEQARARLAQLSATERNRFLARARRERPDEYERSTEGLKDSIANYAKRGFSINMGDAGLGVLAVDVASNIRYGPRKLLFNVAVPGYRARPDDLRKTIGPNLVQLVNMADRQVGLR